jgi:hypothetical protein
MTLRRPRWTADELARLEAWAADPNRPPAGQVFDRKLSHVNRKARDLGLLPLADRAWTPEDVAALRSRYEAHAGRRSLNIRELAAEMGRHRTNVSRKARELGLTDPKRRLREGPSPSRAKHATAEGRKAAIAAGVKRSHAENGHPRGMLGKKKTPEACAAQSARLRNLSALGMHPSQVHPKTQGQLQALSERNVARLKAGGSVYSRCRHGRRDDLGGRFFRSRWEANYARYLDLLKSKGLIAGWEYEVDTFWFEAIRRGVRSYTPDFKVTLPDGSVRYDEVKGWMDAKSKTKLKRMAKYHPDVTLCVVAEKQYREIERKLGRVIPNWEAA